MATTASEPSPRTVVVTLEREWAAAPADVWPYLTVAAEMNRWSSATIACAQRGADGREDAAGARRRVAVRAFGFVTHLEETVVASDPPRRFVYRVTRGGALRDHRGEITLAPTARGTRLVWTVRFGAAVPGLATVLGAILRPQLARSLDALGALLAAPR